MEMTVSQIVPNDAAGYSTQPAIVSNFGNTNLALAQDD